MTLNKNFLIFFDFNNRVITIIMMVYDLIIPSHWLYWLGLWKFQFNYSWKPQSEGGGAVVYCIAQYYFLWFIFNILEDPLLHPLKQIFSKKTHL